ncbi:MAG TPA: ABC transporter substrate-binding protein [Pseudonocardiaceae bacterium]|jgi:peptide/nickel transport system substrate-binding protein|nr:ABC transporter substrate-binding protein [Pseudonocardiaceae bacterium]
MRRFKKLALIVAGGLMATVVAACGGGSSSAGGPSGTLTISNESGGLWTCGFNPFNQAVAYLSNGALYEPLMFVDTLQNEKVSPWLATAYKWSNGNKTLTFTIRQGVKWNDGQPMSAADVLYTFNLLKKNPALDVNSVWSVLSDVKQSGDQVVLDFKATAVPYFYYIADQTPIVPEHIWSKISDPVHYANKNPVATGAYTVSCTPQTITMTANKNYWQPGLPKVQKVLYPAFTSNDPANNYLATGQAQWGSQFIPNIDAFYAKKSPDHHYWFPPVAQVSLFPNETNALLKDVKVRQALAYAVDRDKASSIGEYGYEPAANQMGVVTPTFQDWVTPAAKSANDYKFDPNKVASILEGDGYHKGSDGIYVSASGKRLSFHVIDIGGYSDWVAAMQTVIQSAKQAGIELIADNLSSDDFDNKLFNGQFDLAYYAETAGPSPFYEMRQWLYSKNSAPIGQTATTNFERYNNAQTDQLIEQYGATTDVNTQHQIVGQLEQVMLTQVPIIPVTEAVNWFQYDTSKFTGWPGPANQYALPAAYQYPDMGQVLLHLQPK